MLRILSSTLPSGPEDPQGLKERSQTEGRMLSIRRREGLQAFIRGRRADMVWSALVVVTVLLPLAALAADVPRYFRLRSTLQSGADAAAEAAARCVDVPHFYDTGEARLDTDCAYSSAQMVFDGAMAPLGGRDYYPTLSGLHIDEAQDRVVATAQGDLSLFFGLSPRFTLRVQAWSRFRVPTR